MMRVRGIPKEELTAVSKEDWVDSSRRPYIEGDTAWVPVRDGLPFEREIGPRKEYTGRGYYMVGDIAVVHGPRPAPDEIRKIAELKRPRGIIWREALLDITRRPQTELLWGTCGEVRHRESGYVFILDPSLVMFSQGNRTEKMRVAGLVRKGAGNERVADMFAGIGYFTIPVAGAGAQVHAMEINPVSFGYLERNASENRLAHRIEPALGDCRDLLNGTYDRIIMGHFDAPAMLPGALRHVRQGSIIHLHSIGLCENDIHAAVKGAGFSCQIEVHKVKKYRPHEWHVVHDVTIE